MCDTRENGAFALRYIIAALDRATAAETMCPACSLDMLRSVEEHVRRLREKIGDDPLVACAAESMEPKKRS